MDENTKNMGKVRRNMIKVAGREHQLLFNFCDCGAGAIFCPIFLWNLSDNFSFSLILWLGEGTQSIG